MIPLPDCNIGIGMGTSAMPSFKLSNQCITAVGIGVLQTTPTVAEA
jgi:hypothetical protein